MGERALYLEKVGMYDEQKGVQRGRERKKRRATFNVTWIVLFSRNFKMLNIEN